MAESFFSRLASYSQNPNKRSVENFLTEVLAYLINTDKAFRHTFIKYVIPRPPIRRGFKDATAFPQQTIGRGIVDLVLEDARSKLLWSKLLVEVKMGARETETKIYGHGRVPQIQKYLSLRAGWVAYLTTRDVPRPDVRSKFFLGHFSIEDLHGHLDRKRLSATGKLLLDFLEDNDMKPVEPFTVADLRIAEQSFKFAKKCKAVLAEVKNDVEPKFRTIFHKRTGFAACYFSPEYNSAYCATRFRYGVATGLYLFFEPWERELGFGVSVVISRKKMYLVNRHLKWGEFENQLYSWHPVKNGIRPVILVQKALRDMQVLKLALDKAKRH